MQCERAKMLASKKHIYSPWLSTSMNPELDQHFMVDKKVLRLIIKESQLKKDDLVLEIGTGKGALTRLIASKCNVCAVEKDAELADALIAKTYDNVNVVNGNILDLITELDYTKIISNIPYSISEPLLKKLIRCNFKLAVLTIGKRFYELMLSEKKVGIVSRCFFSISHIRDVSRNAFYPSPSTSSTLVKLEPRKTSDPKEELLKKMALLDQKKVKNIILKNFEKSKTKRELRELLKNDLKIKKLTEKHFWALSNQEFYILMKFLKTIS